MRWNAADLEKYLDAKEYIDTLIIPLQKFQITNETKLIEEAFQREILSLFSYEIEKVLSGRVLLTPEFNYLSDQLDSEIDRLNSWVEEIVNQPFKTIIFLTFDSNWNKHSNDLNGHLLWIPAMQTGDLHSPEMKTLIKGQVEQIIELIQSYW